MIISEVLVTSDTPIFCGADGGPSEIKFILKCCVCAHVCVSVLTCAIHSILTTIRWSKIPTITWTHLHGRFTSITKQWTRLTHFSIAQCVLEMKRLTSCCLKKVTH